MRKKHLVLIINQNGEVVEDNSGGKMNELNHTFNCPKEKTLVDISECVFCGCFNKKKSKFCRFNSHSCEYYVEESIIKLMLKQDQE